MKKSVILLLILCILQSGCGLSLKEARETDNNLHDVPPQNNSSNVQNKNDNTKEENTDIKSEDIVNYETAEDEIFYDASVEALVKLGEDFLKAAFESNVGSMVALCKNELAEEIEKNPKLYIGTKPNYTIDKIDTAVKIMENSKYMLQTVVSAIDKQDNKKNDFKYYFTVEKVKGDYYIIEYKRTIN